MTLRPTYARSRLIATTRNVFLGETTDSRTYLRFSERLKESDLKRRVRVKTVMEMEFSARILARRNKGRNETHD
jgi:hypothetical protein